MKFGGIGIPELVIILIVVLLIFGPKNLPKLGSAVGKTMRNLREGLGSKDIEEAADEEAVDEEAVETDGEIVEEEVVAAEEEAPAPAKKATKKKVVKKVVEEAEE